MSAALATEDLFGHPSTTTLRLIRPIEALSAVWRNSRLATCEDISVISATPIPALCGALMASGRPDSAMQVRDRSGDAVCFVQSIYETAGDGRSEARTIPQTLTEQEVLEEMRIAVETAGGPDTWGARFHYSGRHVRAVLAGQRPIPAGFYPALGLMRHPIVTRAAPQ